MKPAESASLIGFVLDDRYAIVREIGRGGMGVVYEAEHTELAKHVAIKVLLDKYAEDDEAIVRFKREALAASRIGSPHIIDVSHIGTAPDGRPFVVMELLEGESLAALLKRTGPMDAARAVHIMRQVLRAVGSAHNKAIVHRDLKPDNIFIINRPEQDDFVKLLDFGISKFLDTGEFSIKTKLTTTGAVMGTPLYMAPEQAMGAPIAPSVDIYACGVMLYEMLGGRPPFADGNYNMIVAQLLTAKPPRLDDLRKKLPKQLVAAVHRALEKEPAARFATADAFLAALPADAPVDVATATPPPAKRSVLPMLAGAMVVLAGVAIGAAVMFARAPKPPPIPALPAPSPPPVPTVVPAASGVLEIKTVPANAQVKLDGRDAGATPIEVIVKPGRHQLHVEAAGYIGIDADQDVREGERTSATFALIAEPAPIAPVVTHAPPPIVKHAATPTPAPAPAPVGSATPQNPYDEPPPTLADPSAKPNPYGQP
ncbi:MAG TPA: serine/threonine-protein kinase [Kofleriaceae bacterium]